MLRAQFAGTIHFRGNALRTVRKIRNQVIDEVVGLRRVAHYTNISQLTASGIELNSALAKVGNNLVGNTLSHSYSQGSFKTGDRARRRHTEAFNTTAAVLLPTIQPITSM
jgi:hypothetical protein